MCFLFYRKKDMAASTVSSDKPCFLYYKITNENDEKIVNWHKFSNLDLMIEQVTDLLCSIREQKNWVGHCLFKRCRQGSPVRQVHRLMLYGPKESQRDALTQKLKEYFKGSSMIIRVHSLSREDFFMPDDPSIKWTVKRSLYTPSMDLSTLPLQSHLWTESRNLLNMENMLK